MSRTIHSALVDAEKRSHRHPRLRRFVVVDRSMEPTLVEGQGLLAVAPWPARVGSLRVLPHPFHPGRWLVKRVESVDGRGGMRVSSDNAAVTAADSRTFGTLPVAGSYGVLWRAPAAWTR